MKTIVMEHFNSILFYKSEPAGKQLTYQSINVDIIGGKAALVVSG